MTPPIPDRLGDSPSRGKRRGWALLALVGVIAAVTIGGAVLFDGKAPDSASNSAQVAEAALDPEGMAPDSVRIRVRVVNATRTRGLARRATSVLRDYGYDVVEFDGDVKGTRDSTLVLTHTGHRDWSERIVRALGTGLVADSADSSHYVDVTVLIGRDWKAPPKPFRP